MTLNDFIEMHLTGASDDRQPIYVFGDWGIFEHSHWDCMLKENELMFTIYSDLVCTAWLTPKYAYAEVKYWGSIEGRLCVVIDA